MSNIDVVNDIIAIITTPNISDRFGSGGNGCELKFTFDTFRG